MGNHAAHNSNISGVYSLELSFNLNDFNPKYPENPKNLGEKIRKARMDKGLMIKELASHLRVSEDTVINWESRNIKPESKNLKAVKKFLEIEIRK